jgi:RimJ/RimL family protein N-acetyltransferase
MRLRQRTTTPTLDSVLVLSGFLPIRTDRLVLRRFVPADAAMLSDYRSDPQVARYQSWPTPYSVAAARRLIEQQAHLDGPRASDWLQIAATIADDLIGDVAVRLSDDGRTARIGYTIAPPYQRRGFGSEAAGAVVARLFASGLHRVQASLDARNVASARLLERLAFRHEGTAISAELAAGEWCDVAHFAILCDEYVSRVSPPPPAATPSAAPT